MMNIIVKKKSSRHFNPKFGLSSHSHLCRHAGLSEARVAVAKAFLRQPRPSAAHDAEIARAAFEALDFQPEVFFDLTKDELVRKLREG